MQNYREKEMKAVRLGGRAFPVVGQCKTDDAERIIPIVDMPQISDEKWNRMARRQTYYDICPECGAHLDPGERCDCEEVHI